MEGDDEQVNELKVGTIHNLKVLRKIDTGYVLSNGEKEVLLHHNDTAQPLNEEQEIEVFLYHDKKGNLVATTSIPTVGFDSFDWAEVVEVVKGLGVFVDIGMTKEVLVSNDDLPMLEKVWPNVGDMLYVALGTDKKGKLIAEPVRESDFGDDWPKAPESLFNQPIAGRVFRSSKEGAVIITEEGYRGFIHHSERNQDLRLGEWVEGRVIKVKDDGTLNLSLLPLKQERRGEDAELILEFIQNNDGVMSLNDKSTPEEIEAAFHISKSAFKRALGKLMKEKQVEQRDGKTFLSSSQT
ncbi:S1 RNA-binding domain-containing protein [Aquibacillus salsiterrae]|uniref:S1-like domain-containing RNA-binding protein n=1 Tax=Aquibacillus salsiterrae TaxID=2950439 RepID=A0A9X3WFT1_9BACI|nr:S1-like domain-containing RNA-binding protein [Aquibacillus salsiterrae]MDC3416236.1 S1-like domain-containing RNA-binding protein [Aquibacillus salsiterrae]